MATAATDFAFHRSLKATLGLLLNAGEYPAAKPSCCVKSAYCCSIRSACCKTAALEKAVAASVTASDLTAKPICCMKHAYCCSSHRSCCPKASAAGEVIGAVAMTEEAVIEGQIVYVCCPPCTEKIAAEPASFLKQVDELYLASLQTRQATR